MNRPTKELWRRALEGRARAEAGRNRGARARLALATALARAGYPVPLVSIHGWAPARQAEAYLWAVARLEGREDLPAPEWLEQAASRRRA